MKTIVHITAVDWAMHYPQSDSEETFDIIHAEIVGFLVSEDAEKIVLTQQWFDSGQVRQTIAVPKVCIVDRREPA
jgi:hypothetical protein